MQTYNFRFEKAAQKFLAKQDKTQRLRLYRAIYAIPEGDIKRLQGTDKYRLRVGSYRVIYTIDTAIRIITVENIDNRGQVYDRL